MRREKDRKLHRRRHRRAKIKKLKTKLAEARDLKERELLMEKILKISVHPNIDLAKK
ncbi:MAG: hypothetical protein JSV42_17550 [Chloroflexota bacterium]|nr:MAG: hypothetical protein JSV42_17550 [Chloroflexota bacterium]